jgi:hypothetical protein
MRRISRLTAAGAQIATPPALIPAAVTALKERRRIALGRIPVRIETTPRASVAGDESALTHCLSGGEATGAPS